MIYRSSSLLSKNDNASYSVAEMARTPETYLECLLQLNEDFQEAENEYNIAYYRALKESALNESTDLVLSEGLISKAVDVLAKMIEAIINFFKKITAKLRSKNTKQQSEEAAKEFHQAESQSRTKAAGTESKEDPYKKFLSSKASFTYYHCLDWTKIDSAFVFQSIQNLVQHIDDLCAGKEIAAPSDADYALSMKAIALKLQRAATVPYPTERTAKLEDPNKFGEWFKANLCYSETKEVTGSEFIDTYRNIIANGSIGHWNAKLTEDATKKFYELEDKIKRSQNTIKPECVKHAQQYLAYIRNVCADWVAIISYNQVMHTRIISYFRDVVSKVSNNPVDEASTIHGEVFDSNTLFDNRDIRDFNRTEWLDLELTAEAFCFSQAVNEARRSMAVQEAIILAENNIPSDTFRKLQAMQEAEMNKLANAITEIIKRVKEFVTKFINDLQDKHGPNAAFMKRHAELIKKPFKIESVTSTGNILDGLIRMQESRHTAFNPATMNEEDKASMFRAHFLAGFASKANGGKRAVKWEDGITISDYCKAFYGASMPADQYPPVKYTRQDLEAAKPNIMKFMEAPHAFFSKIKQELSELEKEAKKAGAEAARPNATVNNTAQTGNDANAQQQNQNAGQANTNNAGNDGSTQESMFYSVLYDRWFTEADIEMNKDQAGASGDAKGGEGDAKKQNNSKVYIDCLKDILLAKLTAARFIYSECNQLIRAHAKSYMSKEQAAAEAKNEKGAAGNNQNTQQKQQSAEGEQQANS